MLPTIFPAMSALCTGIPVSDWSELPSRDYRVFVFPLYYKSRSAKPSPPRVFSTVPSLPDLPQSLSFSDLFFPPPASAALFLSVFEYAPPHAGKNRRIIKVKDEDLKYNKLKREEMIYENK